MATKRQAPTEDSSSHAPTHKPSYKRHKVTHTPGKPNYSKLPKKAHPVNELKSQIRSLSRLLARAEDALPPGVRIEKERALATAQHELAVAQRAQARSAMIGRFHKIRFFDRQKATRRLKKATRALREYEGTDAEERERLGKKVDEARAEVNYAQYYPLERAYVPLFPTRRKKDGKEEEEGEEKEVERVGDKEMWVMVLQCTADGTLEDLREGRLTAEQPEKVLDTKAGTAVSKEKKSKEKKVEKAEKKISKPQAHKQEQPAEDDDEDSDGGFFE